MSVGSARGAAWDNLRKQVLERDHYICSYCGRDATEADHVIPRSKGGPDAMHNLVAACRTCNGSKSDRIDARVNYVNKSWLEHL